MICKNNIGINSEGKFIFKSELKRNVSKYLISEEDALNILLKLLFSFFPCCAKITLSILYQLSGFLKSCLQFFLKKEKKKRSNKKKYSDEIDRYHEIKEVMSDLERQAERLAKSKERAFGADKLALMDKEIAK